MLELGGRERPARPSNAPFYRKSFGFSAIIALRLWPSGRPAAAGRRRAAVARPKPAEEKGPRPTSASIVRLVLIPVTVMDPMNRIVTGLKKRISDPRGKNGAGNFASFRTRTAPLSVGVVFDCSGSMGHKLEKSRMAVAQFSIPPTPTTSTFLVNSTTAPRLSSRSPRTSRRSRTG